MQPGAQIATTFPPPPRQRPTGITILALLEFIGGGLTILLGIAFLALGPVIAAGLPSFLSVLVGALGGVFIVMGLIGVVLGWGLWTGKGWAWWITVILQALSLLTGLAGVAMGDPASFIGLLIAALILWYMFKPHVKDFFGVKVSFST
uniref:DUF7144 domain-containing protein n=1 Tax=Thermofilum pendens TaxID=2269 RepID=A0A7C4BAG2_THEPE